MNGRPTTNPYFELCECESPIIHHVIPSLQTNMLKKGVGEGII